MLIDIQKIYNKACSVYLPDYLEKCDYVDRFALSNHYYQVLIALVSSLKNPSLILEVGFREGWSALCMSKAAPNASIKSYDVDSSKLKFPEKHRNISYEKVHGDFCFKELDYSEASFIFIDAAHNGTLEREIFKKIIKDGYKGLVLWDDIYFDDDMTKFWNEIRDVPKLELEEFATVKKDGTSLGLGLTIHA